MPEHCPHSRPVPFAEADIFSFLTPVPDPINLSVGSRIGGLGIELHTRRRNRVNGIITAVSDAGVRLLEVQQSYGNCPKYIQVCPAR
jgi:hypothetical protein